MAEVRAMVSVPPTGAFGGFGAPTPCAPIVIDSTTGFAYSMTAAGTVVAFGIGGGVRSVTGPNGVLVVTTTSGAVALGWSGVTAGSLIAATSGTAMGVISAAASGNLLLSNGVGALPEYGKADLSLYVSGDLPFANLTQISGMSVLGVAGSATADVAGIRAGADFAVLRANGSGVAFGAVNLASTAAVTGTLAVGNGGTAVTVPSGVYTPTLFNTLNMTASTAYQCQWMRVSDRVIVSGSVDVDPTAPATVTQLGISLPVASDLGAATDLSGTAFANRIASMGAAILGDSANDRAIMEWVSTDVTNQGMWFIFMYRVL
jgi:hypothetical protein